MAAASTPTLEDFEDLLSRVERLERLLRAQASYHAELVAFAPTTAIRPGDEEIEFTASEAAAYLGWAPSTFRNRRKGIGLKPARYNRAGHPIYTKPDLDRARDRM